MPNAQGHLIGATSGGVGLLISYYIWKTDIVTPVEVLVIAAAVIINNEFMSPDYDLVEAKNWKSLSWLWIPYKKIIKHRSWLSHSGPLSYTIRFLYIVVPLYLLYLLINNYYPLPDILQYQRWIFLFWLGGCISDTIHVLLDKLIKGKG